MKNTINEEINIDSKKFNEYEKIRKSGITNMFDVNTVSEHSSLTIKEVTEIIFNYEKYNRKFSDSEKIKNLMKENM